MAGVRHKNPGVLYLSPAVEAMRSAAREDPDSFVQNFIWITPKEGGKQVLLKYRYGQRVLAKEIRRQTQAGLPVRIFDLKSRQVGKTTQVQSRNFTTVLATNNTSAVTVAHLADRAEDILRKAKDAYNMLPEIMQLPLSRDSKEGLAFVGTGSQQMIISAKNVTAVRSGTHQHIHLSEWPLYDDPELALYEVSQVCHRLPGTSIIIEGTGRGDGSYAHQFWKRCRRGKETFIPMFSAWQDDPECSVTFKSDRDRDTQVGEALDYAPDLEERARIYKLTPGNVVWAANTLRDQAFGNWEKFLEDYPCDEHEPWRTKGGLFFGAHNITRISQILKETPPLYDVFQPDSLHLEGGFVEPTDMSQPINFDPASEERPYVIIYERPQTGRQFVMGGDSAAGGDGGDPSTIWVLDKHTGTQVAEFWGVVQPHQHARMYESLGKYYNNAMAAPEVNEGYGMSTLQYLISYGYSNIYVFKPFDDAKYKQGIKFGWYTGIKTRYMMLALAQRVVEEVAKKNPGAAGMIRSWRLLEEMRSFVENPKTGVPAASSGNNDDMIIAFAIAWIVAQQETKGMMKDDILAMLRLPESENSNIISLAKNEQEVKDILAQTRSAIYNQLNIREEPYNESPRSESRPDAEGQAAYL